MFATVIRRLGQSILVLALVALIAFLIFRFVGDPVNNLLGQEATVTEPRRIARTTRSEQSLVRAIRRIRCACGEI